MSGDLSPLMKQRLHNLAHGHLRGWLLISGHRKPTLDALTRRGLIDHRLYLTPAGWAAVTPLLEPADQELSTQLATGRFRLSWKASRRAQR